MKEKATKLSLHKETVRALTEAQLHLAGGGMDTKTTLTLFCPTHQGTCYCPPPQTD